MIALLLWLLIQPSPGIAGIELNVSDPQRTNNTMIQKCLSYTGTCNVWYTPGTYRVTQTINIPFGVRNVWLTGVTIIPCADMYAVFKVHGHMLDSPLPQFHDLVVDTSKDCGTFKAGGSYPFTPISWP